MPVAGGLGDAILRYLLPGPVGQIAALRRREPDAVVRCALMSTNPHAAEIVAPVFDAVDYTPWDGDYRRFVARTAGRGFVTSGLEWGRPAIHLNDDEREHVAGLGPYITIHPFAGTPNRAWDARVNLHALAHHFSRRGISVVMLGGSSDRRDDDGERRLIEDFEFTRPGLLNLVNRGSVRLQAYLAAHSTAFVGSFSCYHCAAFALARPALVLAGREMAPFFRASHPVYGTMCARPGTEIHYFEDGGLEARILSFAKDHL